jgi:hypothetical protein
MLPTCSSTLDYSQVRVSDIVHELLYQSPAHEHATVILKIPYTYLNRYRRITLSLPPRRRVRVP